MTSPALATSVAASRNNSSITTERSACRQEQRDVGGEGEGGGRKSKVFARAGVWRAEGVVHIVYPGEGNSMSAIK